MKCNKILKSKQNERFLNFFVSWCDGGQNTSLFFYEYAIKNFMLCQATEAEAAKKIFIHRQFYVIYIHCLIELNAR